MTLFAPQMPCDTMELRRVYLRLALRYHPDKCPEAERVLATQLFQAIAAAYEELLKALQPEGQHIAATRVKTPTAAAAELGDLVELRRLLEELPARVSDADDVGACPLVFAAIGGCIGSAAMLLDYGADIHALSKINWPAHLYAALHNHEHMVRYLISRGARVTEHDLILTAWTGNSDSFKALCDFYEGSITAVKTNQGTPLLHLACEGLCFLKNEATMHAACVEMLLAQGALVNAVCRSKGCTCLHALVNNSRWRTRDYESSKIHMDTVEALCVRGASVSLQDSAGESALSMAAEAGLHRLRSLLYTYV